MQIVGVSDNPNETPLDKNAPISTSRKPDVALLTPASFRNSRFMIDAYYNKAFVRANCGLGYAHKH